MRRLLCEIFLCGMLIGPASAGMADTAYDDAPFDMEVASLPPGYRGVDAEAVHHALVALAVDRRGELETVEQYRARVAAVRSKPLLGSLTVDSLYAFRLPIFPNRPHYDDDARLLDFQPTPDGVKLMLNRISNAATLLGGARDGLHFLVWKRTDSTLGTYGAPGALGATRKLTKMSTVETGIELCEGAPIDCRELPKNVFAVSLSQDAARDATSHAAFLYIGHLRHDLQRRALFAAHASKPTAHMPYERTTVQSVIGFEPTALWIFNVATGEILKKVGLATEIGLAAAKPGAPPTDRP